MTEWTNVPDCKSGAVRLRGFESLPLQIKGFKPMKKDWRLFNQEKFLQGKEVFWRKYIKPRVDWDHDYCEFCWAKFSQDIPD